MILINKFVSLYYNLIYNMRYGYIYKITSPSGRIYIGKTVNFNSRMSDYRCGNTTKQKLINNSINKYGFENHKVEILLEGEFEDDELNNLEIKYIKENNSIYSKNSMGMNLTSGGEGVCGLKQSPESIAKMIETRKNNPPTEKELKARERMWGRKINKSEEWIKNNSMARRKPIAQYDLDGNFMREWAGAIEAEIELGFNRKGILNSLKKKCISAYGYIWRYKNDESSLIVLVNKIKGRKRKIINLETNEIYDSVQDAANSIKMASRSLSARLCGTIKNKTPMRYA